MKNGVDPKCRFCDQCDDTIAHLVSGCSVLTPNEYKNRHDGVGQYLEWKICKHYNTQHVDKWCEPVPVVEGKDATLLWDFPLNTEGREIQVCRGLMYERHMNQ